jgi:hypothetical protein
MAEVLRWSQTVIELTDGDPAKGNLVFGSPFAVALASRGTAQAVLGRAGWREDYDRALAMAPGAGPMSHGSVIGFAYGFAIPAGVLLADDASLRDTEEAVEIIERSSEDFALGFARLGLAMALVHRESPAERERGLAVLGQIRDMCLHRRFYQMSSLDVFTARERARCGDRDGAIPQMCAAIDDLFRSGQVLYCFAPTNVLVETLLERGANGDVIDAEAAIARLAAAQGDEGPVGCDIWLLRMRALLARSRGDDSAYLDYRDRYRVMATSLGYEGHIAWAEAMS